MLGDFQNVIETATCSSFEITLLWARGGKGWPPDQHMFCLFFIYLKGISTQCSLWPLPLVPSLHTSDPAFPTTSFKQWRISGPLTFSSMRWPNCHDSHAMFSSTTIISTALWVCFSFPLTLFYWGNHCGFSSQFFKYFKHISSAHQDSIAVFWPARFRTMFPHMM